MARLNSWLSADVMHALGWALIHSLWQCLGLAALAAVLMAFSRRPPVRYLVATGALVAMLAVPVATFLVLMHPAASVHALLPSGPGPQPFAGPAAVNRPSTPLIALDAAPRPMKDGAAIAWADSPTHFLSSRLFASDLLPPNILPWLVGAWLCGVALFSLRFAGGFLLLEHKRRRQFSIPGPRILATCQELQRRLGLNRAIRYLECGWLQAPAVIGWIRPIVLLPVSALTGLSEAQLRAVIAHELAHVRRHDFFVNLLQILVETLLFYHPAIWWLNRRIRAERELCCDEIAVSLTGNRMEYAKALTLMAEWEKAPALAMAANRGPLSQRIFHILGRKPFSTGQRMLGLAGSILFLAAALGAANALFGIAHPMAHAKARLKVALSSSQIAVDHIARQVLQAGEPAVKAASQDQSSGSDATNLEKAGRDRTEVTAQAEKLMVQSPDLSRLLPTESLLTPAPLASNEPPTDAAQPASKTSSAALAASNGASAAQTTSAPSQTPAQASICAVPKVAGEIVDLKEVPGSDLMTVPVGINGKPKQFLLDIGTNPDEVSQATTDELHLPQVDQAAASNAVADPNSPIRIVAASFEVNGADTAMDYQPRVRVASFTIAGAAAHKLEFLVANDRDMGKSEPYDGRLTGSLFPQYDMNFDFGRKQFSFLDPTRCTDPSQVVYWPHKAVAIIPMMISNGKMSVPVTINGHQINAVLDTGSAHTVMRRDIAEMVFGLKAGTLDMMPAGDTEDGTGMQVYRHTFPQIAFEGVIANNVPALIQTNSMVHKINRTPILGSRAQFSADPSERIPELALGMDVLHQLHLYAAFDENKLYVTAARIDRKTLSPQFIVACF